MQTLLLLAAFFAVDIQPKDRPVYRRDLVSMYAGKQMAMAMQTIPGSPFSSSGGSATTPGGNTTEIQFNDAGAFGGDSVFTWNKTTDTLTVIGTSILAGEIQQSVNSKFWSGNNSYLNIQLGETADTPDTGLIAVGTLSRGLLLIEGGDEEFDFAHPLQTNPTLFIHSATQSTTQWISLSHNGTDGVIAVGAGGITTSGANFTAFNISAGQSAAFSTANNGAGAAAFYPELVALTPDGGAFATGSTANSIHFVEQADTVFDFNNGPCGTAACAQPTLVVHGATQNTTEYLGVASYGLTGGRVKALTAASATSVVQFPITTLQAAAGNIVYAVYATDATDVQVRSGQVRFAAVNKAGTETCAVYGVDAAFTANPTQLLDGSGAGAITAGTLTYTWGVDTTPTNACTLTLNAASSLTEIVLQILYVVTIAGSSSAPIPQ